MITIRALGPADAADFAALRRQGLEEVPLAFSASPEDDVTASPEETERALRGGPDRVVWGAFSGRLVGVLGFVRERHRKTRHKALLWGMYVHPDHRQRGIGRALIGEAVRHARSCGLSTLHLSVSEATPAAARLYEETGFRAWGREPSAIRLGEREFDELHMLLRVGC